MNNKTNSCRIKDIKNPLLQKFITNKISYFIITSAGEGFSCRIENYQDYSFIKSKLESLGLLTIDYELSYREINEKNFSHFINIYIDMLVSLNQNNEEVVNFYLSQSAHFKRFDYDRFLTALKFHYIYTLNCLLI